MRRHPVQMGKRNQTIMATREKRLTPEEKKYEDICKLVGVWSLTELRFVSRVSVLARKGVGKKTMEYIKAYLTARGLTYGKYSLDYYLKHRKEIWADATGLIVFKYKIRPIVPALGITKEWAVGQFTPAKANFTGSGRPKVTFRGVLASEARELIEDRGLVLAHETADGVIYDTPDRKFLEHFGNKGCDLSGARNIDIAKREEDDD